jgi:CDP-glucose 4,6-dehydratase
VLVTGHTGFKGGWLTLWLDELGASVHGYSLNPPTEPNLFEVAGIGSVVATDVRADLCDLARLKSAVSVARPEVVFHLAAQPLVRESYRDPLGTLASNVIGTAHILEAVRDVPTVRAVVVITTDKVYVSHPDGSPHSEENALGGLDPYSASKAAAEIVAASYRASFFALPGGHSAHIATVRAGNVIGGGDWAVDRLVPDCMKAFSLDRAVQLRNPHAVRPWQHVLEPLSGYLLLAQRLLGPEAASAAGPWNFGPNAEDDATVGAVAEQVARLWGHGSIEHVTSCEALPEVRLLRLDSSRARTMLGWKPRWSLHDSLRQTVEWHKAWLQGDDMADVSRSQLRAYMQVV